MCNWDFKRNRIGFKKSKENVQIDNASWNIAASNVKSCYSANSILLHNIPRNRKPFPNIFVQSNPFKHLFAYFSHIDLHNTPVFANRKLFVFTGKHLSTFSWFEISFLLYMRVEMICCERGLKRSLWTWRWLLEKEQFGTRDISLIFGLDEPFAYMES